MAKTAFGMGSTSTHFQLRCTGRPPIPFCMRMVNRPSSRCQTMPIASSGCGHSGYRFAVNICRLESRFTASLI